MGLFLLIGGSAHGAVAAPWREGFEGPTITWRDAGGNARYRVLQHQRVSGQAHSGRGVERLAIEGQGGNQVLMAHDVGRPMVIAELRPAVWIRSDRAGLQLLAEVALPRSLDPRTGQPIRTLLCGTSYSEAHRWQQLRIENLPELLARQVLVLRAQLGPQVDAREAYVERILLNVYGGPGATNVWIDDLDVAGHVSLDSNAWAVPPPAASGAGTAPPTDAARVPERNAASAPRRIELNGSILKVDGEPTFIRAIEYQGESLARLKEWGFNTIWLKRPATESVLDEAARQGLLVVCPPPAEALVEPTTNPLGPPAPQIGSLYASVAAWDLGWGLSEQDIPAVRQLAQRIRMADRFGGRPLIAHAEADLRGLSRPVDLLMVGQSPLATSLELTDYATWIRERPRLARPGTIVWSTVQTEPSWALMQQWLTAGRGRSPAPSVSSEQIRLVAYTAIAAGSRGLLFESSSSLEASDPATQARAAALALLNLEIELIRPWVAAGSLIETIESATVPGKEPEVGGAVFRYAHTRLLVPLWIGRGAQFVPGQSAGNTVQFVVPNVPSSTLAYELSSSGLQTIRNRPRVTGGTQITLEEFSLSSLVLFTEDPRVFASLKRRAAEVGPQAAKLARQLAAWKLDGVREVARRLIPRSDGAWRSDDHLTAAERHLAECDAALGRQDWARARLQAERTMRRLRLLERTNWEKAASAFRSPMSSPATVCFSTLPWHWSLVDEARAWQLGPEQLAGGEFENLGAIMSSGWRLSKHEVEGLQSRADVVPEASHSGATGLRLVVQPTQPDAPPTLVETPPLWFTTPPVHVEVGQLVQISGWVHVPIPITGSVDGLLIFDSMSGRALAERIGETTGWQPFTLFRVATQSGPMHVTFALAGLGEVWIDDVSLRPLGPGSAMAVRPGS